MVDINLLPDELRGREAAERKRLGKTPKVVEYALTRPPRPGRPTLTSGGTTVGQRPAGKPLSEPLPPAPPPMPSSVPLPERPERARFAWRKPVTPPSAGPPSAAVTEAAREAPSLAPAEAAALAAEVKRAVRERGIPPTDQARIRIVRSRGWWAWLAWIARLFVPRPKRAAPHRVLPAPSVPLKPVAALPPVHPPLPPPVRTVVPSRPPKPPPPPGLRRTSRRAGWKWWQGWLARRPPRPLPAPATRPAPRPPTPLVRPPKPVVPAPPTAQPAAKPPPYPRPEKPASAKPAHPKVKPSGVGHPPQTVAINLIPDEFTKHPELNLSRKFLLYLAAIGAAVFAVVTVSQVIAFYLHQIGNEIRDLEQQNTLRLAQIETYQTLLGEAEQLQQNLRTVEELLSRQRYWTRVFAALEQITVDEVWFSSFRSASDGAVELMAQGKDYTSVARQLVALRDATDVVDAVSITGASASRIGATGDVETVNFSILVRLKPTVFQSAGEPLAP